MKPTYKCPYETVNSTYGDENDNELYVYGTHCLYKQLADTIPEALNRYKADTKISIRKLSRLTGIPHGTLSRYFNGTLECGRDNLCAICIALRLKPCRQRHLFDMLDGSMPQERGKDRRRNFIIREVLDGCFYDESCTVALCNQRLVDAKQMALTPLFSPREDK